MKNRMGLILLILICVGLSVVLIWNQKQATEQQHKDADTISTLSNKWIETSTALDKQKQVNTLFENDLRKQREAFNDLTNAYTEVASNLDQTQASLKNTQEELTKRDAKIADLESQNQALDERAIDLSTAITNLTAQIDDTRKKLTASEGDKAFLEKELQRLMAEKAELERQFNDLSVLRAQVAKLKEELNISRRLEWIRQGLFARADQKGAEQLMQKASGVTNRPAARPPSYDLNVEVSADGTVKVIPPATNSPAGSNAPPAAK